MRRNTKKLKMAESGAIHDPRVFKLMFLEKAISETKAVFQLKKRACNDEIERVKNERRTAERQAELSVRNLAEQNRALCRELEDDYGIKIYEWGYDDVTGTLERHPPEVLSQIHERLKLEKARKEERIGVAADKEKSAEADTENKQQSALRSKKSSKKTKAEAEAKEPKPNAPQAEA